MDNGVYDPLLLTMMFVLDFLCIHPFSDGNGRMSRLLTLLLLYRCGFIVGKITKREILTIAPDISEAMVEKSLAELLAEGFIEKVGNGRGSGYICVPHEN